jgi:hypothetical protein
VLVGVVIGLAGAVVGIGNHRLASMPVWQVLALVALAGAAVVKMRRPGQVSVNSVDLCFVVYIYLRLVLEVCDAISLGHHPLLTATLSPTFDLACYAAARLVVHDHRSLRRFLAGVLAPAIPSVLLGFAELGGISSLNHWVIRTTGSTALIGRQAPGSLTRASGLIGQWTDFGGYLCAVIALALILIVAHRRQRRPSRLAMAILILALIGTVTTLTFSIVGAALALPILCARRVHIRFRYVMVVGAVLALSAPVLVPFVQRRVHQEYVATNQTLSRSSGLVPETLVFRIGVWEHQTWPAVAQRSLTGWGQGVYPQLRTWTRGPTTLVWPYPESQYFEELMSGGVIELIGLLVLLGVAYRALGRVPDGAGKPLRVLIIAMLFVGITVPSFTDVGLPVPMWAGVGAMLSLSGEGTRVGRRTLRGLRSGRTGYRPGRGPWAYPRRPLLRARQRAARAPVTGGGLSRTSGAGAFGGIRIVHLGLLAGLSVVLAHLLSLHQYGLYTRGSFFSNVYATVMLLGQDQLVMQRRLPMPSVRLRGLVALGCVTVVTLPIAAATLSGQAFAVVVVSSISSAGMVIVYGELSRLMALGWHLRRGVILLLNAVLIQLAGVIAALFGADALVATAAGAVVSLMWVVGLLTAGTQLPDPAHSKARFRDGIWMGMSATLYASIPTLAGIIVAIRASDQTAGETRFVLLAFSSIVAICSAINSEYFRSHMFAALARGHEAAARHDMIRANVALGVVLLGGLPMGALLLGVLLGHRYAGAAPAVAALVAAVPFLLSSQVQTNIEVVAGRTWLPLFRNAPAAAATIVAMLLLPATTTGVDIALIAAEAIGLIFFVVARRAVGADASRAVGANA